MIEFLRLLLQLKREFEPILFKQQAEEFTAMKTILVRFSKDESGSTVIEYALIGTLVGLAIIAGASTLGSALGSMFDDLGSTMSKLVNR